MRSINTNMQTQTIPTVTWLGHVFNILDISIKWDWHEVGGIYIFCGISQQNYWVPLYVGQADSFRNRIPSHERWSEAQRLGASHILAMVVEETPRRAAIEQALIRRLDPPMNDHFRL